jgi:hypothetical protein
MARTSDRVSKLAGKYINITPGELLGRLGQSGGAQEIAADIRSIAASALRQDETRGLRGAVKKLLGR